MEGDSRTLEMETVEEGLTGKTKEEMEGTREGEVAAVSRRREERAAEEEETEKGGEDTRSAMRETWKVEAETREVMSRSTGERTRTTRPTSSRDRKRWWSTSMLLDVCLVTVIIMQVHMFLLLYSKIDTLQQDMKGVSCAVYGKDCPDALISYQCMANKLDTMEMNQEIELGTLRVRIEEIKEALSNYTIFVLPEDGPQPGDGGTLFVT